MSTHGKRARQLRALERIEAELVEFDEQDLALETDEDLAHDGHNFLPQHQEVVDGETIYFSAYSERQRDFYEPLDGPQTRNALQLRFAKMRADQKLLRDKLGLPPATMRDPKRIDQVLVNV